MNFVPVATTTGNVLCLLHAAYIRTTYSRKEFRIVPDCTQANVSMATLLIARGQNTLPAETLTTV